MTLSSRNIKSDVDSDKRRSSTSGEKSDLEASVGPFDSSGRPFANLFLARILEEVEAEVAKVGIILHPDDLITMLMI